MLPPARHILPVVESHMAGDQRPFAHAWPHPDDGMRGANGQVYAVAQGPVVTGGFVAGRGGNNETVNHPTVGRIPNGGLVERDAALDLAKLPRLSLLLSEPDFTTAEAVAAAINP